MRVTIEFTHNRGQLAGRGNRAREPLTGELTTHVRTTQRGLHHVAELRSPEVMEKPLAELHEVSLYCIGHTGFQLRGLECISTHDGDAYVLQGWLVTPLA